MAYSQSWLESQTAIRGILVEVTVRDVIAGLDIVKYLSNIGYITEDSNTSYLPIIAGTVQVTESLSIEGSTSMSFGDVEIVNANGELDDWLDNTKYIWVNKPIQIYYGDPGWVCNSLTDIHTDFEKVFDGVVADIDSKAANRLNIKVRDKLERLNTAITENKLGTYGTWASGQTNQDTIIPLVFGEVFNIEPLLIDPALIEFTVSDGPTERIIEIRDNGVPIYNSTITSGATVNLTTGKFKLTKALAGTCTVSVQGVKKSIDLTTGSLLSTYNNNIANIIALIVTQYGKSTKLLANELDLLNLSSFASTNTQSTGIIIKDRTNVLIACQELADSIGAQLFMTRKGLLQLLRIGVPTSDTSVTITSSDILFNSLSITSRSTVISSSSIGYCKNHTVQTPLLTAIPEAAKSTFATEWYSKTVTDEAIRASYLLSSDPPIQKDTALITGSDALTEVTRLNNFFKVPKTTFSFTGTAKLLSLKLGQAVVLTHPRFGLSSGKTGQVIGLTPNWSSSTISVEVLI